MAAPTTVQLEWSDGQLDLYTLGGTFDRAVGPDQGGQVRAQFLDAEGNYGPWGPWVDWSTVSVSTPSALGFFNPTAVDASTYIDAQVVA